MRITKRLGIFVLTAVMTFTVGVFVARLVPKHPRVSLTVVSRKCGPSAWRLLHSFRDRDLQNLDQRSERVLRDAIDGVRGQVDTETMPRFVPSIFRVIFNTDGKPRYVLVEEAQLLHIPGSSYVRVHVFETEGTLLKVEEFSEYRRFLERIDVRKVSSLDHEVLIVDTRNFLGNHPTRHYYALVGNQLRLVYLEQNGRFDASGLTGTGLRIERSVDEWEKALHSEDQAEVMSALLWLSGNHWTGQPMPLNDGEAEKVENLLARKDVHQRLVALSGSGNRWIKTAARSIVKTR